MGIQPVALPELPPVGTLEPLYKETIPVESDDADVEIGREVPRTSVVALDVRTGRFEVIEH